MTVKKTNLLLLIMTLMMLVVTVNIFNISFLTDLGDGATKLIEYGICTVIGLIFLKANNESISEFLPYNVKPKLKTMLWVIVLFVLIYPVNVTLAYLGGTLFGDTLGALGKAQEAGLIDTGSASVHFFESAVIPAFFEEIFYRGFFYQGYKKNKGTRIAIILSSVLFATFHMVPQQVVYTIAAGFVLALLRELSGSMWPSTFLHLLNNGIDLGKAKNVIPFFNHISYDNKTDTLITAVLTAVCCVLIYLIMRRISVIEGREEDFRTFFKEDRDRKSEEKLFTAGLVITLIIELLFMIFASFIGFNADTIIAAA